MTSCSSAFVERASCGSFSPVAAFSLGIYVTRSLGASRCVVRLSPSCRPPEFSYNVFFLSFLKFTRWNTRSYPGPAFPQDNVFPCQSSIEPPVIHCHEHGVLAIWLAGWLWLLASSTWEEQVVELQNVICTAVLAVHSRHILHAWSLCTSKAVKSWGTIASSVPSLLSVRNTFIEKAYLIFY